MHAHTNMCPLKQFIILITYNWTQSLICTWENLPSVGTQDFLIYICIYIYEAIR